MPKQTEITYETPDQPRQIRLDSTTACNASCSSCHRWQSKRNGKMSQDLILEILKDVSRWEKPLEEIVPVNYGEFFVLDNWEWVLNQIAVHLPRTPIVIPTNGVALEESLVQNLCEVPTFKNINFSINAYFDETYEAFMGLPPEHMQRIEEFCKQIKTLRQDVRINVSMVFDPVYQTDLERDMFIEHWRDKAYVCIIPAASAAREDKMPQIHNSLPCRSIFSDFVVGYDRKLTSCCFDSNFEISLGSYTGDIIRDWHNQFIAGLRLLHNEHRRDKIRICSFCSFA